MSGAGKVIAASAILLIVALGLIVWMRRAPAVSGGAAATSVGATANAATGAGTTREIAGAGSASAEAASGAPGDAALPPGTTIGPNGVVFHNPAITGKPPVAAQKLNVPKPVLPRVSKPNPEAVRNKLHPAP